VPWFACARGRLACGVDQRRPLEAHLLEVLQGGPGGAQVHRPAALALHATCGGLGERYGTRPHVPPHAHTQTHTHKHTHAHGSHTHHTRAWVTHTYTHTTPHHTTPHHTTPHHTTPHHTTPPSPPEARRDSVSEQHLHTTGDKGATRGGRDSGADSLAPGTARHQTPRRFRSLRNKSPAIGSGEGGGGTLARNTRDANHDPVNGAGVKGGRLAPAATIPTAAATTWGPLRG
jgi:hypothetical protein